MALPPWLQPADLVGAAQRGAALGLSLRAQDQAAEEHAARLALAQDEINVRQQQHALAYKQAEARAAEALRQHNALELYREKTFAIQQRLHAETAAREEAKTAAREALDREKFEWQKGEAKARSSVRPEIQTVTDPLTGEEHSVIRTGPNTFRPVAKVRDTAEQKALTGIEQRDLQSMQRELQKERIDALKNQDAKALATAESNLLKNKTAQSNLVLSAKQPSAAQVLTVPEEGTSMPKKPAGTEFVTHISTKEDYDSLPSGAIYINDKTGLKSRKP